MEKLVDQLSADDGLGLPFPIAGILLDTSIEESERHFVLVQKNVSPQNLFEKLSTWSL
jgi:hypothetical protein